MLGDSSVLSKYGSAASLAASPSLAKVALNRGSRVRASRAATFSTPNRAELCMQSQTSSCIAHRLHTRALSKARWRRSVASLSESSRFCDLPSRSDFGHQTVVFLFLFVPATPTLNSAEKKVAQSQWLGIFIARSRSGEKAPLHAFSRLSDAAGFCRLTRG